MKDYLAGQVCEGCRRLLRCMGRRRLCACNRHTSKGKHMRKLLNRLTSTDDFVMVHSNELQAILDYVEDMEQRISIVRDQLQYLLAESVEPDEESNPI
jgi:hypothetical protein